MADVPAVTMSSDPEAPTEDALDQATEVATVPEAIVSSIDIEVPEADALDQAVPAYFDEDGDDRR